MKKIVVVGTGFSGSIIARRIAEEFDQPVHVIEKRQHIAGNMYDERDEHGILLQKYGPHVLVTNEWRIISYLSQFSEMYQYTVKELSYIDGRYVRLPFNFESVQQLLGYERAEAVIKKMRGTYPGRDRVPIRELADSNEREISEFATMLFEKSFRTYCAKQWGVPTEKLDKSIMNRSAIALGYDERYMNKDFQFLPVHGFTELFQKMLNHPNISVELSSDALERVTLEDSGRVLLDGEEVELFVYTGPVDELFNLKYGELPYRSLDIRYEWFDVDRIYPEAIISYPQAEGYTRRTEYKFLMHDRSEARGSTVATEYPIAYKKGGCHAPYYPEITEDTKLRYAQYAEEAQKYKNIFLCGRLAEFRYYNMDDCILRAFEVFEKIKTYLRREK